MGIAVLHETVAFPFCFAARRLREWKQTRVYCDVRMESQARLLPNYGTTRHKLPQYAITLILFITETKSHARCTSNLHYPLWFNNLNNLTSLAVIKQFLIMTTTIILFLLRHLSSIFPGPLF